MNSSNKKLALVDANLSACTLVSRRGIEPRTC
jgi:hypothetical protein